MEASSTEERKKSFSYSAPEALKGMHQLFKEGKFVDCALITSDTISFRCHRAVLSAASPILHEAFLSQHESSFPCVMLFEVSSSDLCLLVEYIYKGKVQVSEDRIEDFKKAGEKLQICGFGKNEQLNDTPSLQAHELVQTSGASEPQSMDESRSQSPIISFAANIGLEVVLQKLYFEEQSGSAQPPDLRPPFKARRLTCTKSDKVRFHCQHCSKSYSRVYSRNYHQLECNKNPNRIPRKCSNCDTPVKPSAYKKHIKKCSAVQSARLSAQKSRAAPRRTIACE